MFGTINRLLLLISVVLIPCVFTSDAAAFLPPSLPQWVIMREYDERTYISGEDIRTVLKNGRLRCSSANGAVCCETTPEWTVADAFVTDIDRDGDDEVILLVWKIGSFGKYKPFWREDEPDRELTEHIFIFDWDSTRSDPLVPKWMSSDIKIKAQDVFPDEARRIHIITPSGDETVWAWESWGLSLYG